MRPRWQAEQHQHPVSCLLFHDPSLTTFVFPQRQKEIAIQKNGLDSVQCNISHMTTCPMVVAHLRAVFCLPGRRSRMEMQILPHPEDHLRPAPPEDEPPSPSGHGRLRLLQALRVVSQLAGALAAAANSSGRRARQSQSPAPRASPPAPGASRRARRGVAVHVT